MKSKKQTKYLIVTENGRYLGNSVWTFERDRAIHYNTLQDAEKRMFACNVPVKIERVTI